MCFVEGCGEFLKVSLTGIVILVHEDAARRGWVQEVDIQRLWNKGGGSMMKVNRI